ncbi:hypothetical protein BV25DRAFT_1098433, partial [Artomyces pyxidatus]
MCARKLVHPLRPKQSLISCVRSTGSKPAFSRPKSSRLCKLFIYHLFTVYIQFNTLYCVFTGSEYTETKWLEP